MKLKVENLCKIANLCLIKGPSEGHSSCDVNSKLIEGNISIEFQPEEIGMLIKKSKKLNSGFMLFKTKQAFMKFAY